MNQASTQVILELVVAQEKRDNFLCELLYQNMT